MDCEKDFSTLLTQFKPMIYHIMKKLHIYKNTDEFYQIGCIAIWEASQKYDQTKGSFTPYLYQYMKGRMMTELTNENKYRQALTIEPTVYNSETELLTIELIHSLRTHLSPLQMKWLTEYCVYGKTPSEIAAEEHVSISSVKSWRREAIKKIRKRYKHYF